MNDISYEVAMKRLGLLIEKLRQHPKIMSEADIKEIVDNLKNFFSVIDEEMSDLLEELRKLRYQTTHLSGDFVAIKPEYEDVLSLYINQLVMRVAMLI